MSAAVVEVLPDSVALAGHVAGRLVDRLVELQRDGHVPSVVLTGGTIAEQVHAAVAQRVVRGSEAAGVPSGVDWRRVEVWWGDERFVPADDEQRNAGQARRALLDHLPLDPHRVHEVPASDSGVPDVEAAAAAYHRALEEHAPRGFDIVMLGVGPDGHVASLFPGRPELDVEDVDAVAVRHSPKPPPQRVSMTYRALGRGREVWFLVSGEAKADAVARALAREAAPDPRDLPAAGVTGLDRTVWMLDAPAASRLAP